MAGLYDDLPEPLASSAAPAPGESAPSPAAASPSAQAPLAARPEIPSASGLFTLGDETLHAVMGCLPARDAVGPLPATCRLLLWLQQSWGAWQRVLQPLRRNMAVRVVRLQSASSRTVEDLAALAASIEAAALHGFGFAGLGRHSRLLGGVGGYAHFYGELPMPRVVWSLHSEGLTGWRGICSMIVDAGLALLPPWGGGWRRSRLPRAVRLHVGISLWLPPEGVEAEFSYPSLYLNVALDEAELFEVVAAEHPQEPPLLAANCEAVLFRPGPVIGSNSGVVEEWSLRFCFGPGGAYRHVGHGETDGYVIEAYAAGRRRWRPPDLCYAAAHRDEVLHLLLRLRRCDGLLD